MQLFAGRSAVWRCWPGTAEGAPQRSGNCVPAAWATSGSGRVPSRASTGSASGLGSLPLPGVIGLPFRVQSVAVPGCSQPPFPGAASHRSLSLSKGCSWWPGFAGFDRLSQRTGSDRELDGLLSLFQGIQDGVDVVLALNVAVPPVLRVDHHGRAALADLQAAGAGHLHIMHAAIGEFFFDVRQEGYGAGLVADPLGTTVSAEAAADKDVMLEFGHVLSRSHRDAEASVVDCLASR